MYWHMQRKYIYCLLIAVFGLMGIEAEAQNSSNGIFRIFEDNDFLNYRGHGTDCAYSDGFRLDAFFPRKKGSHLILDRMMPRLSDSSIKTFGIGIMQQIYTPNNIESCEYQPKDYRYAGSLFTIISNYSFEPVKKMDIQEELIVGVMGPMALGAETQTAVHHIIHYTKPMGWPNQLKNDVLLNFNFTVEKQIASVGQFAELIGGSTVQAGTQKNAVTIYPLLRIGKMTPYFNGFLGHFSSITAADKKEPAKWQIYFFIKPQFQMVLSDAMLEGGLFNHHTGGLTGDKINGFTSGEIEHNVYLVSFGLVAVIRNFSLSFTQTNTSMLIKQTYSHEYGNITLSFGL